jgi:hypothetical protein
VKKLMKFVLIVAFVFGGWALAAASLHVVRAPGTMCRGVIPANLQIIPKNTLTYKDTFVDTTKWSSADVAAHPVFVDRLQQTNKMELIKQAMEKPAPSEAQASAAPQGTPAVSIDKAPTAPVAPAAPAPPAQKSIFDFGK